MENLLLLHGALGAQTTFTALKESLREHFTVFTLNFSGHGGLSFPDGPFSMEVFVNDILAFLNENSIQQTHIFGYSMGGYASLYFALKHPEKVKSIFTLATKFKWSPEIAAKESQFLDPDKILEKVPRFAQVLKDRHAPQDWKVVLNKTAAMMKGLGLKPLITAQNLPDLHLPVRIAVGDHDNMVSLEESIWAYRILPNGSFLVFPDTKHPLELVLVDRLSAEIQIFVGNLT